MQTPRRRAALRKQRETFLAKMFAYSLIAAVVGSGLAALNVTNMYLIGRNNITAYIPEYIVVDGSSSSLVMLTDADGKPLAGENVDVEVRHEGQVVWTGTATTDATGIATPSFVGLDAVGPAEVVVRGAGETLMRKVEVETTTRIYLQTDKPIYQPGQTVHIRTLAFSGFAPEVSMEDVILEVSAPSGDRIFRKTLVPDEYGIASYDYPLGTRLPLGLYKIKALIGQESVERAFGVQRYILPRFIINYLYMRGWYEYGESITGSLCADYTFGKNVQGSVMIVATPYPSTTTPSEVVVNDVFTDGCIPIQLPGFTAGSDVNSGYVELKATVTDTAGHSETKTKNVPLSSVPIILTSLADTNIPYAISEYYVIARWPDGLPVPDATVTCEPSCGNNIQTDARGVAKISFTYRGESSLKITVRSGSYKSELLQPMKAESGIKVVADASHYEVGQTATINVYFSGESLTNWAYYEVISRNFVVSMSRLSLSSGSAQFYINVDQAHVPMAEVRVYKVMSDLTVSRDHVVFTVGTLSNLQVSISADKMEYRPGEDVRLDFAVQLQGSPVSAALGISIVDTAVYEVDERFRGLEDAFKGEEGTVPYETQVIEYIYGERSVPPDIGAPLVVSPQAILGTGMQSSMPANRDQADSAQSLASNTFLSSLMFIGLVGYLGLIILGIRNRKYMAIVTAIAIAIPAISTMVYVSTSTQWKASVDFSFLTSGTLGGGGSTNLTDGTPEAGGVLLGGGSLPPLNLWETPRTEDTATYLNQWTATTIPTRVRSFFPETWYWNPSLIVGPDGVANLTLPAPDSITTWAVDAVASTKTADFGSGSTEVRVFQDFFLEPDIPVVALQNDTFDLRVSVFNYLPFTQDVTVVLQSETWFTLSGQSSKTITIPSNTVSSTYFTFTANEVGEHNITIFGGNWAISDAVRRLIRVDPRGSPIDETHSGRLSDNDSKTIALTLDPNRIPGTEAALVRVQPSMNAVVIDGAENYIQYVSGCGEQSMSTLNIDVLAFRMVSEGTSEVRMLELERIVTQGIQHELQFLVDAQNGQGRGIVWFPGDRDAHPWLTSWGLITFKDAVDAGFGVDEQILTDMQSWLASVQGEDGSWEFPEWGIYEFNNPILRSKRVASTAYIARALMYSGYPPENQVVQRALGFVESNVHSNWDDPYTLSLSLISMVDGGGDSSTRSEIASRLVELKREDNGTVYWKSPSSLLSDGNVFRPSYWGEYDSKTSETTGYAVMALFKQGYALGDIAGGMEYLLSKRNSFGGYMSTQDTIVALQALLTVGSGSAAENLDVEVRVNGVQVGSMHFDQTSRDLTYLVDISSNLTPATVVELTSAGSGSVVYQVVLSQYLPWDDSVPPCELCLTVDYSATSLVVGQNITASVGLSYNGNLAQLKMVLVSLKSGVGLMFDTRVLDQLVTVGTISLYELSPGSVLLYIQNVPAGATLNFDVVLEGSTPSQGTVPGASISDLYDPGLTMTLQPTTVTVTR